MLNLRMPKWTKSKTARYLYKFSSYRKRKEDVCYIDKKTYRKILVDFFEMVQLHLLNGATYYPPYGMGEFRIHKYKQKPGHRSRNYNLEKKYYAEHGEWKKFYHQNFHSDGERAKTTWFTKGYSRIPSRRLYRFYPPGALNDKLAKKLLNEGGIDDFYKVGRKTRLKDIKTLI